MGMLSSPENKSLGKPRDLFMREFFQVNKVILIVVALVGELFEESGEP